MAILTPTQDFVPIKEIKNGVVILKDNSFRMVLMTSSVNFALKSEDEQQALLLQFQNFLNTLDFSIQISVQSRELDIRPYLALLENQKELQNSELMKIQITEYIEFIKKFTESINIMTKSFFIVIPYTPPTFSKKKGGILGTFTKLLPGSKKGTDTVEEKLETFEEHRTQIEQRASIVEQGLSRTGVRVVQLGTEELIELYYKIMNPGEQEKPITLTKKEAQKEAAKS